MNETATAIDGAITARGIRYSYRGGREALRGVDASLSSGSFAAIIGPNGSGKSTLLRILAGLLPRSGGSLEVAGIDPGTMKSRHRARRIAYLPQDEPEELPFTALELVLMGRFAYQGLLPFDRDEDLTVARECLALVEAQELEDRLLVEMSGGERQRIHLARALAQMPRVLLLDEPSSSLDLHHQIEAYRLLRRLVDEERRTVVVVSHDLNLPAAFAEQVIVLSQGEVHAAGPPLEILRASVLEPVYRTRILEARVEGHPFPVLLPAP
jgi:iron complex transport system ATP-binding protein